MEEDKETMRLMGLSLMQRVFHNSPPAAQEPAAAPPKTAVPDQPPTAPEETKAPLPDWDALLEKINNCQLCKLHEKRTNAVPGVGDRQADWLFVGEGPGEEEDRRGEPFVGAAGMLLDRMLQAMGLSRQQVYICNVVKCRPPRNRNPEAEESAACFPYLKRQIELVSPKLIVALGRIAAQRLLDNDESISRMRGRLHNFGDIPLVVTYHPAYLLRTPEGKAKAWADLCLAMRSMNRARSGAGGA